MSEENESGILYENPDKPQDIVCYGTFELPPITVTIGPAVPEKEEGSD